MEQLRKPFFIAAIILIGLAVLLESGSGMILGKSGQQPDDPMEAARKVEGLWKQMEGATVELKSSKPPGVGIRSMALLDGLLVFTVGLMAAQFVIGERLQGRIQGIASLVISVLLLLAAISAIFVLAAKLLLMIGLFLATPFGTIAYLARWGSFNTSGAATTLGILLLIKLGFAVCLFFAHHGFIQNKSLMALLAFSFVANLLLSFLHGLVPSILVSITDCLGGIVLLIFAAVWAIILLVFSTISMFKAVF